MDKSISRKTDLVDSLERDLADCISNIAAVLSVFPDERDWDALEHEIVRSAKFRRRLAGAVREAFEATGVSETAQIRKVRRSVKSSRESIYVTGKTLTEAEAIEERAKFVGTTVIGYGRKALVNPRYWTPLIEVSARNGYHV